MSQKFNPQAEIANYNKIVKDRGYDAFSKKSIEAWRNEYGHIEPKHIYELADFHTKNFLDSLHDISRADHEKNRQQFQNQFGKSRDAVKAHFVNKVNLQNGRKYKGSNGFGRDLAYEERALGHNRISGFDQNKEKETLKAVLRARWDARGYDDTSEDNDQAYVDRFYNEYAFALQKKGASNGQPFNKAVAAPGVKEPTMAMKMMKNKMASHDE